MDTKNKYLVLFGIKLLLKGCIIKLNVLVKAVTLIFISGRGSAISSAKQGKLGSIYSLV